METRQKNTAAVRQTTNRQQLQLCAIIALSLVLVIYLAVSTVQRNRLNQNYAEARNQLSSVVEQNINLFVRTCDSIALAGADVENDLLPHLHTYYYAMEQLDDALTYSFGPAYTLLSDGVRAQLTSALSAYDEAFRMGKSTDSAYASLTEGVNSLKVILNSRFSENGDLLPAK